MTMRSLSLGVSILAFLASVSFATAQEAVAQNSVSNDISHPPAIAATNISQSIVPVDAAQAGDIVESRPLPSVLYALSSTDDELTKKADTVPATVPTADNKISVTPAATASAPAIIPGTENLSADELFAHARDLYSSHNYADAFPLYRQAANMGHTEAQYMTGLMLYRGEGIALADTKEAARYYQMAADKGFAKAQYNLAVLYYDGAGVARDDTQAYKWLYLSSLQGEPRALKMLPVAQRNLKEEQKASAVAQADLIRQR